MKLSKAARAYHPGKGVYRSSYQNALRLTRIEINSSYRAQENKRWRAMPFVLGFEVKRSKNASAECICDALAGVYLKAFLFSGWHPNCLCQALPILLPRQEFTAKAKKIDKSRYVQQIPPKAKAWIDKNKQKIRAYKNPPLFIKDNFVWDEKRKSYEFNKR